MERLKRKFETARTMVPAPVTVANGTSKIGLIAYGTTDFAVAGEPRPAQEPNTSSKQTTSVSAPFRSRVRCTSSLPRMIASTSIEQNRDAQMLSLLKLDLPPEDAVKLRSVRHYNGLPIDARSVTDELVMQEGI